jgi:hypothetical protein
MDTSIQYIQMCDTAKEIQDQVKTDEGIVYAQKWCGWNKQVNYNTYIGIDKYKYDKDVYISDGEEKKMNERWLEKLIWLPRQDQLQQMILMETDLFVDYNGDIKTLETHWLTNLLTEFHDFFNKRYLNKTFGAEPNFKSFEQAWLSYVMKEVYRKQWNPETKQWIPPNHPDTFDADGLVKDQFNPCK